MRKEIFDWLFGTNKGCASNNCNSNKTGEAPKHTSDQKLMSRRDSLKILGLGAGAALTMTGAAPLINKKTRDVAGLKWKEYFKTNYRLMSDNEKEATVRRLEKLAELRRNENVTIATDGPLKGVLFGYAFNISKCRGYMDCIDACVKENNQDRKTNMQYITIHEMKNGRMDLESSNTKFHHEVPVEGNFYLGTQCFHCENPPCVDVCPVGATWKEEDGIVVVDYDWCIGCRYCEAACPYWGRRFNWNEPEVPKEEKNKVQHYLGNRERPKGVMEKCTFCVQRTRKGQQPACVDACPTGARVFGNLLDPDSEIRYIIENKKVFRMKEELGTEPKFWYYMD